MQRTLLSIIFIFLLHNAVQAQGYRGRDFWVCFPQNAVDEGNMGLSLSLYICAEARTTGTITNLADSTIQNFALEYGSSIEKDIDTAIEIRSSEITQNKVLHIVSDHDISLYVVSHRPASTDSYMAIPTPLLGKEYIVAGYSTFHNGPESFTSQATIAAPEDHTFVTIHLNGPTSGGLPKGRTLMFGLNRGETFQIQGSYDGGDLTGSTVTSTKPIAFFTGHRCAQVPADRTFCNMLLESEPPSNDWGTSFIVTKCNGKDYSVARVIANVDSTDVFIDGKKAARLMRGECYEVDTLRNDAMIAANKPVLVAQYCTSFHADSFNVGDPFMLFVIPDDRFVQEVTTTSVIPGPYDHYLNVVVPDTAAATLRLDGVHVTLAQSTTPSGYYSKRELPVARKTVYTFRVPTGRHLLQCSAPIAVYSYGFGSGTNNFDSYGHACGMRLAP